MESPHWFAFVSYGVGIAGGVLLTVGVLAKEGVLPAVEKDFVHFLWTGGVCYAIHLIEAFWFSRSAQYLCNVMNEDYFQDYVRDISMTKPSIEWETSNWHMEEYKVTKKTQDGREYETTETRIVYTGDFSHSYPVSFSDDETLSPQQMLAMFHLMHDASLSDDDLVKRTFETSKRQLLLCNMPLVLSSYDHDYSSYKSDWFRRNHTDRNHTDKEREYVDGHRQRVMLILQGRSPGVLAYLWARLKLCWISPIWFMLCTFLLLSIPYRLMLFASVQKVDWPVVKRFSRRRREELDKDLSSYWAGSLAARAVRAVPRETKYGAHTTNASRVAPDTDLDDLDAQQLHPVPTYWKHTDLNAEADEKVKLPTSEVSKFQNLVDATFKQRATRDRAGEMPVRLKVEQVVRLEDHAMWNRYAAKRCQLLQQSGSVAPLDGLPGSGVVKTAAAHLGSDNMPRCLEDTIAEINEAFLFHGTGPSGAMGIGENGFDMSKAGSSVGSMFGAGAYFAEASSKSDEYATEDGSGLFSGKRAFLLCRVALGNMYYITQSNIHEIEQALGTGKYHAVLGDRESAVDSYREFVAFDQHQIYPEYVIIYERLFEEIS